MDPKSLPGSSAAAPVEITLGELNYLIDQAHNRLIELDERLSKLTGVSRMARRRPQQSATIGQGMSVLEEMKTRYKDLKAQLEGGQYVANADQAEAIKAMAAEMGMQLPNKNFFPSGARIPLDA